MKIKAITLLCLIAIGLLVYTDASSDYCSYCYEEQDAGYFQCLGCNSTSSEGKNWECDDCERGNYGGFECQTCKGISDWTPDQ